MRILHKTAPEEGRRSSEYCMGRNDMGFQRGQKLPKFR